MPEQSKASKLQQHGIPWAAVVVAALGWYDARSAAVGAEGTASTKAQQAQVNAAQYSETRARNAWEVVQEQFDAQKARVDDLENWVVELEEFIEDHVEEDSPRGARERLARRERLEAIRTKKAHRVKLRASEPQPMALPDYAAVQEELDAEIPDLE